MLLCQGFTSYKQIISYWDTAWWNFHPGGCKGPGSNPRHLNTKQVALCLQYRCVYTAFVSGGSKHGLVIRMKWPTKYPTHLFPISLEYRCSKLNNRRSLYAYTLYALDFVKDYKLTKWKIIMNTCWVVDKQLGDRIFFRRSISPRITCYSELGGSGNSEVNNGRRLRLGSV